MISVALAPVDVFEVIPVFSIDAGFSFDAAIPVGVSDVALVLPLVVEGVGTDTTECGLLRCVDPYYLYNNDPFPLNHWRTGI